MTGLVTQKELLNFCDDLASNPYFESNFKQLIEVSAGALAELHYGDLEQMRRADPFTPASKRAIAVHSDVDFGVARMYEMIHGGNVRVFRSVDEALQFLDSN